MQTKDKETTVEKVNFLQKRKVRIIPISKKNPFSQFSLEELNTATGKYETKANIPEQFNNTYKHISLPISKHTGEIVRVLDNTLKVYTEQYPYLLLTEQEFFETSLGLEKGALDPSKMYQTADGNPKKKSFWATSQGSLKLDNSPLDLDLSIASDMIKYKVALANTKSIIAPDTNSVDNHPSYTHVITDLEQERQKESKALDNKMQATIHFAELKNLKNIKKLNDLHSLLSGRYQYTDKFEAVTVDVYQYLEKDPINYIRVAEDPKANTKLLIMKAVKYGEIRATEGKYKLLDGTSMGTYSETIEFLEDNENFTLVEKLKNRLEKNK